MVLSSLNKGPQSLRLLPHRRHLWGPTDRVQVTVTGGLVRGCRNPLNNCSLFTIVHSLLPTLKLAEKWTQRGIMKPKFCAAEAHCQLSLEGWGRGKVGGIQTKWERKTGKFHEWELTLLTSQVIRQFSWPTRHSQMCSSNCKWTSLLESLSAMLFTPSSSSTRCPFSTCVSLP